ncbi:hypothetical protein MOQ_003867 [Trypanosoma cruzi marinkellei]|uniref:F-box domain-containing protein n=1 Tax=Trypanosoma cruzi marinkellei TaxID=85056 RepID=K2MAV9_TRYCR|nr:hypothetical protein MOQ_003867 [Trypanosoma cruzi marinkellei]
MEGVSTPSSSDGSSGCGNTATAAAEASATDGNPGGRCVWRHTRKSGGAEGDVPPPAIHRISQPLAIHTAGTKCGVSNLIHGDTRHSLHVASSLDLHPHGVCGLPVPILDVVFNFLSVDDLRTVLGVCRCFYRAVSDSDRTAWKAACFSIWHGKQGFARVMKTWAATEEAHRLEELEIISMQQQMLIGTHMNDSTTTTTSSTGGNKNNNNNKIATVTHEWVMFQVGEKERDEGDKHHQERHLQEHQQLFMPSYWTGRSGKSGPTSLSTTPSDIDSAFVGARSAPQQLWDRVSLRSTPTYDAIMSTVNSPHLRASLISPLRRSASSISSVESVTDQRSRTKTKLYWWQMAPERRQQQLYCMQQKLQRRRLRAELQNQRRQRHEDFCDQLLDEEEEETDISRAFLTERITAHQKKVLTGTFNSPQSHESGSSNSDQPSLFSLPSAIVVTATARGLHCTGKSRGGVLLAATTDQQGLLHATEEAKEGKKEGSEEDAYVSDDGLGDCDNESEADGKHYSNPYQEFEEEMALTHSLSVLQYAQQKAMRFISDGNKRRQEGNDVDNDEEDMQLPVSWKFAYYMSLRDARREKITMQELIEDKWYVCFRATGKTHPATFTAKRTLIIHPAMDSSNNTIMNIQASGDVENDAAMPPLLYHLLKGGSELVVHNFPPLKVYRRSALTSATDCNKGGVAHGSMTTNAAVRAAPTRRSATGNNSRNQAAAERAFIAEPDATLRRLRAQEEKHISPGEEDEEDIYTQAVFRPAEEDAPGTDWGWVIQNYFVKIFSVETHIPVYIQRLRRTCAPRPP